MIEEFLQPRITDVAEAMMPYIPAFQLVCHGGGDEGVISVVSDVIDTLFLIMESKFNKIV